MTKAKVSAAANVVPLELRHLLAAALLPLYFMISSSITMDHGHCFSDGRAYANFWMNPVTDIAAETAQPLESGELNDVKFHHHDNTQSTMDSDAAECLSADVQGSLKKMSLIVHELEAGEASIETHSLTLCEAERDINVSFEEVREKQTQQAASSSSDHVVYPDPSNVAVVTQPTDDMSFLNEYRGMKKQDVVIKLHLNKMVDAQTIEANLGSLGKYFHSQIPGLGVFLNTFSTSGTRLGRKFRNEYLPK